MGSESLYRQKLWIFLGVALGVRLFLAALVYGYPSDMGCFSGWSEYVAGAGFSRFYSGEIFADYPPGYIYPLFLVGTLRRVFQIPVNSAMHLMLVKMPALLADMVLSLVLYQIGKDKIGHRASFLLALAFAFNPAVGLNSALWGQVDSFFMLPLSMGIFLLAEGKVEWSVLFWTLALLVKPQALFFAPLWLFAFIEQKDFRVILKSVLTGTGTFVLLSLPFSGPETVIRVYRGTVGSYPYATLNAFNFLALLGGNWVLDQTRNFFLSYRNWGYLMLSLVFFLAAFFFFRGKGKAKFFLVASFLAFSVFLFAPRMHERYLFPALFLCLLWYLFEPRRELLFLYFGLSGTFFVNVGLVLLLALLYEAYHLPRFNPWLLCVSALNCALWGFLFWTVKSKAKSEGTAG
ncbi:MAG: hypothetical protein ACP5Q4_03315 [Candidatus Caldatribacteriaceae bacterium]